MRFLQRKPLRLRIYVTLLSMYGLVALFCKLGWLATPWDQVVGGAYVPPQWDDLELFFGTDIFGRSVLFKALQGTRVAIGVGLITTLMSVPIGITLGGIAGYFGGWIDEVILWFISTLASIPYMMLVIAIAYVLGRGLLAVYVALGCTAWISLARVVRGEVLKHRSREYVLAAESMGASIGSRIFRHILPNVMPLVVVQSSLQFVTAVKAEVILSFLGLGVHGQPSWGVMIDDSKLELARGVWWQLGSASFSLFGLVLLLNLIGDELRDALVLK